MSTCEPPFSPHRTANHSRTSRSKLKRLQELFKHPLSTRTCLSAPDPLRSSLGWPNGNVSRSKPGDEPRLFIKGVNSRVQSPALQQNVVAVFLPRSFQG